MLQQMKKNGHKYVCLNIKTGGVYENEKLPPILKILRTETNYTFKIPHGNKIRTMILEEGICIIYDGEKELYRITIVRW